MEKVERIGISIEKELEKARRNALLAEQVKEKELRKIANEN